jgi:O-antigen ligase
MAEYLGPASEQAALWILIGILAWVQFPLGSNRAWSWSLLILLVALDWLLWIPAALNSLDITARLARRVALPGLMLMLVLVWACVQSVSLTPTAWHNSIWDLVGHKLNRPIAGAISINPFETETEVLKLASYVAIGWLAAALAVRYENARSLFVAVFAVGVIYAAYGIALSALGTSQSILLEGVDALNGRAVSGGFVSKNSFATFTGMALLSGLALVGEAGQHRIVTERGWRTHVRTLLKFATGRGAVWLVGSITLFSALVAANSRAGLMATLAGLLAMFVLVVVVSSRNHRLKWTFAGGTAATLVILTLFFVNGQDLQSRFENLIETRGSGDLRSLMWSVATRAIGEHPVTGTGLGTYTDAYQLYTDAFVPYVVDRAHNDYLEFAMGLGIPAASMWILALVVLTGQCVRGALKRRRRRIYAMTAAGASVLVGLHSAVDFSLQMPAVSVVYAILMGVGLSQTQSRRDSIAARQHGEAIAHEG